MEPARRRFALPRELEEATRRIWTAVSADNGSGLPTEIDPNNINLNFLLTQYGPEILSRVNLDRGRVRPNFSLGAAAGIELYKRESGRLNLQVETNNLTGRVNVLNFAGLFSGTAVGTPRSASVHLRFTF
jgi:hypothetical protein